MQPRLSLLRPRELDNTTEPGVDPSVGEGRLIASASLHLGNCSVIALSIGQVLFQELGPGHHVGSSLQAQEEQLLFPHF